MQLGGAKCLMLIVCRLIGEALADMAPQRLNLSIDSGSRKPSGTCGPACASPSNVSSYLLDTYKRLGNTRCGFHITRNTSLCFVIYNIILCLGFLHIFLPTAPTCL